MMVINEQEKKKRNFFRHFSSYSFLLCRRLVFHLFCFVETMSFTTRFAYFFQFLFLAFLLAEWNDICERTTPTRQTKILVLVCSRERENFNLSLSLSLLSISKRGRNAKPNRDYQTHHSFCQMISEQKTDILHI